MTDAPEKPNGRSDDLVHSKHHRRSSSTALLDRGVQVGAKLFHQRRPSSSAATELQPPPSPSDQRQSGRNSWLKHYSIVAPESLRHFVAERKASVDGMVRRVRTRGTHEHPLVHTSENFTILSSEAEERVDCLDTDSVVEKVPNGFDLVPISTSLNRPPSPDARPPQSSSQQAPHTLTSKVPAASRASVDGDETPRAERRSLEHNEDEDASAFYTPAGSIATGSPWISQLSANPFVEAHFRSIDPFGSDFSPSSRRHSTLSATRYRVGKPRQRMLSASSDMITGPEEAVRGLHESMAGEARPQGPRTYSTTPVIIASTSDSSALPVDIDDPQPSDSKTNSLSHGDDNFEHQQIDKGRKTPAADVPDVKSLQLRIVQLEKELFAARRSSDLWKTKYLALSSSRDLPLTPVEKNSRRSIDTIGSPAESRASDRDGSFPSPPREREPAGVSTGQTSSRSATGGDQSTAVNTSSESDKVPLAADRGSTSELVASEPKEIIFPSDDSRSNYTSPSYASSMRIDKDSVPTRPELLLRPLSVSDDLSLILNRPCEGIDAATLNSLMPEETRNRRQRGASTSGGSSGFSGMAAGWKAKLRSSPVNATQPLPSMPARSPNRPTLKLFGRKPSTQTMNASVVGDDALARVTSLAFTTNTSLGDRGEGAEKLSMLSSPRASKVFDAPPLPKGSRPSSSSGDVRRRSASVTSRIGLTALQTHTRRVSATFGKASGLSFYGGSNASTTSAVGTGQATGAAGGRAPVTASMISQPMPVIPPNPVAPAPAREAAVETTKMEPAKRNGWTATSSPPPHWLESIAFEAESSEDGDSPRPARQRRQLDADGMNSAKARSTVLDRYSDMPIRPSTSIGSGQLLNKNSLDDKTSLDMLQMGMNTPFAAIAGGAAAGDGGLSGGGGGALGIALGVPAARGGVDGRAVTKAQSSATLASVAAVHHGVRGEQGVERDSISEQLRERLLSAQSSGNTSRVGSMHRKSMTNSLKDAAAATTDSKPSSVCAKQSGSFLSSAVAHLQPKLASSKGSVSTRASIRSQTSLRNRPQLVESPFTYPSSPLSASTSKLESHEVRLAMPSSPPPLSPALSNSPPMKSDGDEGTKAQDQRPSTAPAAPSPPSSEGHGDKVEKRPLVPAPAPRSKGKLKENPLKRLNPRSLISKRSGQAIRISSPETSGPTTPAAIDDGENANKLKIQPASLPAPASVKELIAQKALSVHAAQPTSPGDAGKRTSQVRLDWLQACIAFGDNSGDEVFTSEDSITELSEAEREREGEHGPESAVVEAEVEEDTTKDISASSTTRLASLEYPILMLQGDGEGEGEGEAAGLGIITGPMTGDKDVGGSVSSPPPLPPKNGMPSGGAASSMGAAKYVHITPPTSDDE